MSSPAKKRFTLADVDFLTSASGQALLAELQSADLHEDKLLRLIAQLRAKYTPEQTSAALATAQLRAAAVDKFGESARQMLFTPDALEQASDAAIRAWRADLYRPAALADLCSGIGSDALSFAAAGASVVGIDLDPVRVAMANFNAAALGVDAHFVCADVLTHAPAVENAFFDPARRDANGRRIYNVEQYIPPFSSVARWQYQHTWVKLSPGVDLAQLPLAAPCEVGFVSVDGALKESYYRTDGARQMHAVLLTGGAVHTLQRPLDAPEPPAVTHAPRAWLCEPDAAAIRGGFVRPLAHAHDGTLLDESIAYFTTDTPPNSVWVRAWQILEWMPFNLKKLRAALSARNMGRVTVKKRGSPITPEELSQKLRLKGQVRGTVVLTQFNGAPIALICADYTPR